jgi:hypothetical protein
VTYMKYRQERCFGQKGHVANRSLRQLKKLGYKRQGTHRQLPSPATNL